MNKCVGFGSDGASNMAGSKSGLIVRIKEDYPQILGIHCLAHRLELSFKDSIKKVSTQYDKLTTLLLGLYYFYKRSPLQRKTLKETFKIMQVKGGLPQRIGGSRWMPHMKRALETLFRSFPAYLSHLQNQSHKNSKAEGLAKILGSLNTVCFALMLHEVLDPLCRLSLMLQSEEVTLGECYVMVMATKDALNQLRDNKSEQVTEVISTKKFMEYDLRSLGTVTGSNVVLIDGILNAIDVRFKDVLKEDLEPTVIASFRMWPSELEEDFGVNYIERLSKYFKPALVSQGVDVQELVSEWKHLKCLVYRRFPDVTTLTLSEVNRHLSGMGVSNVLKLLDLVNSLPPTSVYNETGFNQMKLCKTERRHRLSNSRLDDCMITKLESPAVKDFDPTDSINSWMTASTSTRRPLYNRGQVKKTTKTSMDVIEIIDNDETNKENEKENEIVETDNEIENEVVESDNEKESQVNEEANVNESNNAGNHDEVELDNIDNDIDSDYEDEHLDFEYEQSEETNCELIFKYATEE